jgi:CBS domain-containing protein
MEAIESGSSVGCMPANLTPYRGSYLLPAFENATVLDVMRPGVMSCAPDASLLTVAQTMATHHVHSVVVTGLTHDDRGGDHLVWGLISDMDLVRAAESGIEGHTAADAARTEVVTVDPTTLLPEAAALMDEHATAHLLVLSGGRPAGVISSLDLAGALAWGRA